MPDSDTNSLEQDINTDFEENFPHQEHVISEIYQKAGHVTFQITKGIAKPSEYRQIRVNVFTKTG